jgi:hypothetical protein
MIFQSENNGTNEQVMLDFSGMKAKILRHTPHATT